MPLTLRAALSCHSSTPEPEVASIEAAVLLPDDGSIALAYTLYGRTDSLDIPEPRPPVFRDELWRRTCFEVFLKPGEGPAYLEFNFSPSGEWAAYGFDDYRVRNAWRPEAEPTILFGRSSDRLRLQATLPAAFAAKAVGSRQMRIALSAVVQNSAGRLSYWALRHPVDKPDFHHPQAFAAADDALIFSKEGNAP